MTTLYCAICAGRFEPDQDHIKLDAHKIRINDRNEQDTFALHPGCYRRLTEGWIDPA